MIKLKLVSAENIQLFRNLYNLYCHDLAPFNGAKVDKYGIYKINYKIYYTHPGIKSFIIYYKKEIAGLIVITRPPYFSTDKKNASIDQMFILNGYRRKGIGAQVVKMILTKYPGKYGIGELPKNKNAIKFWRDVLNKNKIQYSENLRKLTCGEKKIEGYITLLVQNFSTK